MSNWLKIAIACGGALLLGLLVGFLLGVSGKGDLETQAQQADKRRKAAELRAKEADERATGVKKRVRRRLALLRAKEQLFRALLQLKASNFGISAQHLSHASTQLKRAARLTGKSKAKLFKGLRDGIAGAHAKTMALDPVAQVQIEALIEQVHGIRGAR